MYIPSSFDISDIKVIRKFIQDVEFGQVITSSQNQIETSYLPFILDIEGDKDCLITHFARSNGHWEALEDRPSLVTFLGPHTYVSHKDYGAEGGVPTWNYAVVEAKCSVKILTADQTKDAILKLLKIHEGNDHGIPDDMFARLSPATVGAVFKVESYECKFKFSQNRSDSDFYNMLNVLKERGDYASKMVVEFIDSYMNSIKKPNKRIHSDIKKQCSSCLVTPLFDAGDAKR